MMQQGLVQEVKNIVQKYNKFPTAMQGLGYKEVVDYLEGKCTEQEMIDKIKMETRRYAKKRQLTWFRKNKQTIWLDGSKIDKNNVDIILEGNKLKEKTKKVKNKKKIIIGIIFAFN